MFDRLNKLGFFNSKFSFGIDIFLDCIFKTKIILSVSEFVHCNQIQSAYNYVARMYRHDSGIDMPYIMHVLTVKLYT